VVIARLFTVREVFGLFIGWAVHLQIYKLFEAKQPIVVLALKNIVKPVPWYLGEKMITVFDRVFMDAVTFTVCEKL
jgi:hypothetical protein